MPSVDSSQQSTTGYRLKIYGLIVIGIGLGLGRYFLSDNSPLAWAIFIVLILAYLLGIHLFLFQTAPKPKHDFAAQVYETLFNQNNDAVFILNLEGRYMSANQGAICMLGYTQEELKQLSFRDIVLENELNQSEDVLKTLLAGGTISIYERTFCKKNGDLLDTELNVQLIRDAQQKPLYILSIARDISERKQAEQALRDSEARLKSLIDLLPERAVILNSEGRYLETLKHAKDNIMQVQPENIMGKTIYEIFEKEFADFCHDLIEKTLETQQVQQIEYKLPFTHKTIYVEGRIAPYHLSETEEQQVIWVTRDISKYKEAESQLQQYNRFQQLLTSLASEFINLPIEKLDNSITRLLQQIGEFIGADRSYINWIAEDLSNAQVAYQWYAADVEIIEGILDPERVGKVSDYIWSMNRLKNAETILIPRVDNLPAEAANEKRGLQLNKIKSVVTIPLILNDHFIGSMGFHAIKAEAIWTEATVDLLKIAGQIYLSALERKQAYEAVRDSEKRLRLLVGALPDRSLIFNEYGVCTEVIKSYYESSVTHEIDDIEFAGQSIQELYSKEFTDFCLAKIKKTLETRKMQVFRYTCPTRGEPYQLEARTIPFIEPQSMQEHVFWVTRDITERVLADERHLDLTIAQEKNELLRQFVDSMTHDLKTPLSVISTSMYLLDRQKDESKKAATMNKINRQVDLLVQMLDDMLAIARLDTVPTIQLQTIDVSEMVQEIVENLQTKAEHKNLIFETYYQSQELSTLGAGDQLRRALTNVIDNAIKYTPENGRVAITVECKDDEVIVIVDDSGIGISHTDIKQVFNRFYRANNALKIAPGTGLGLEITRRIIESHQGHIDLSSELGRGSTFTISLPIAR